MPSLRIAIALAACLLGASNAFATAPVVGCLGTSDDGPGVCDITATVSQTVPAPPAESDGSVALSTSTQTNFVKYSVTLEHYDLRREGFGQVKFAADTVVTVTVGAGPAKFVASSPPVVANSGNAAILPVPIGSSHCVISGPTFTHVECTFNFDPLLQPFDYPPSGDISLLPKPRIRFELTVQSPTGTGAGALNVNSTTSYSEPSQLPESEYFATSTLTNLTVPNPTVVETFVPVAGGTVTTGAAQGAATCVDGNKFVTIVKVPQPAQVGVNLNIDDAVPPNTLFFSRILIPDLTTAGVPQLFGPGTRWYDPDAKNKLVVNTLRRDMCTIGSGTGSLKDGLLILKEKIFYKPDIPYPDAPELTPVYKQLLLCLVTSGPYPGQPCIVYAQVYTRFNLPNVPNKMDYLGDHEWVIFSNENGRIALPTN